MSVPLDTHQARGFSFDDVKAEGQKVLDLFGGVSQQEIADGTVDASTLPREDRISILIDGSTPSVFGSSPWAPAKQLNASVAQEIHQNNGGTLVFGLSANVLDLAESKVRAVRYALVWDDSIVAETGTLDLNLIGQTFLIIALQNEPLGQVLTLWLTDSDIQATLVQQGTKQDVDKIRQDVIGKIGAAAGTSNPFTDGLNAVGNFFTVSTVGGLVALGVIGLTLVFVVRSESFKDVAKAAAKAV